MNVDINQRRAAAIRRHRGKPHVIAALKAKVYDLVRIDMPLKEIAALVELSNSKACKWIHVLGFRQMYVSAEERAHLLQRRSAAMPVVLEKEAA